MEAEVELRIWDQLKKEWILIFKRKLDRIIGIKRPSAERAPCRRQKYPVNPVNPVKINEVLYKAFRPAHRWGLGSNIGQGIFVGWVKHPYIFCWVSFLYPTYLPAIFMLSAKPNKMAEDRIIPTDWNNIAGLSGLGSEFFHSTSRQLKGCDPGVRVQFIAGEFIHGRFAIVKRHKELAG